MHPEIRKKEPGTCPICGMALESLGGNEAELEFKQMRLRLFIGLILTTPILVLAMIPYGGWIQAILATVVVFFVGSFFLKRGWRSLNMFTLISLGVMTAYIYSLSLVLFFPSRTDLYFEAAAMITVLVTLGQVLELKARVKTGGAIRKLLELTPSNARIVMDDGTEKDISLEEVKKGDKLRVRPGDKVPTDGVIIDGSSAINESMLTGEALPVSKTQGDQVTGSTINGDGSFLMEAQKVGGETVLSQIVQMVSKAQSSKAPIQKIADLVSSYFVPAVLAIAIITFGIWMFFDSTHALVNAVAVLIIACPCALGLATPVSIMVGVGRGALEGLLIKDAASLETAAKVDTVVVDKTGTLTEGKPLLTYSTSDEVLQIAASLEVASEHPLAKPIVEKVKDLLPLEDFQAIKGKGVKGKVQGKETIIGNQAFFQELGIDVSGFEKQAGELREKAETVFYLAVENKALGILSVADVVKETTPEAIEMLHKAGVRILMVTGDNKSTAAAVAKSLGIDEVEAEVLPENKGEIIKRLQSEGHIVAMAGDGVNDAPALALANVGIAMGTGTDVAMESAGVTLMQGDLRGIARAITLSRQTVRNIKQNLLFAFLYNALAIPIAAGVFYPAFGLLLSPIIASGAMAFSSVSVIVNALRLRKIKI